MTICQFWIEKEEEKEGEEDHSGSTDSSASGAIENYILSRRGVIENANLWILKMKKKENLDIYASTDSSAVGVIKTDILSRGGVIENNDLSMLKLKRKKKKKKNKITINRLILVLAGWYFVQVRGDLKW